MSTDMGMKWLTTMCNWGPKQGTGSWDRGVVSMSLISGLNCVVNIHITGVRSIQFPQDKLSVVWKCEENVSGYFHGILFWKWNRFSRYEQINTLDKVVLPDDFSLFVLNILSSKTWILLSNSCGPQQQCPLALSWHY